MQQRRDVGARELLYAFAQRRGGRAAPAGTVRQRFQAGTS
jgi:hypothetical protein